MAPEPNARRPIDRASAQKDYYRFWCEEQVRFGDIDILGHVTNTAYLHYAESVRAPFMREIGMWQPQQLRQGVVVHHEVDYLRELGYPARPQLGLSVVDVSERSYAVMQAVFHEDLCRAVILTRMVRMDTQTRRAVPLDPREREALLAWMRPSAQ